jgi:CSLREA domain-containing protein
MKTGEIAYTPAHSAGVYAISPDNTVWGNRGNGKNMMQKFLKGVLALALLGAAAAPAARAETNTTEGALATLVVNTAKDDNDLNDNLCSLREAMQRAANNDANNLTTNDCPQSPSGNTTINFAVGNITLSNAIGSGVLPDVTNKVTWIGPVTIDAKNLDGIMQDVESNGKLSLVNVTIKNAKYTAIDSRGDLKVAGGKFENNGAAGAGGGAIRNDGTAMIAGVSFVNNRAVEPNASGARKDGGAIRSTWVLTVAGSTFTGNTADGQGGAIMVQAGRLEIVDSAFTGNVARGQFHSLNYAGNGGQYGDGGGAIATEASGNTYPMVIRRSAFQGNTTLEGSGGAIFHNGGTSLTISDSSFQGNHAGKPGAQGAGGAIFNVNELILKRSTFTANSATGDGGALANDVGGQVKLQGVGFAGNNASGNGGAIANMNLTGSEAKMTMFAVQVTGNIAGAKGGGIYNHDSKYDTAEVRGSVWAGNLPENCKDKDDGDQNTPDPNDEEQFPIDSKGQNYFSDNSCEADEENDDVNPGDPGFDPDPGLNPPAANGGPPGLLTMAPVITSPLVDKIAPQNAPTDPEAQFDVRGMPRGMNGTGFGAGFWDIGPFERDDATPGFSSLPVAPGPINIGTGPLSTAFVKDNALVVYNSGEVPLALSGLTKGGANPNDFALTLPAAVNAGSSSGVDISCTPAAAGSRSATISFNTNDPAKPSVSFDLTCTGVPGAQPVLNNTPKPGAIIDVAGVVGGNAFGQTTFRNAGNATLLISNVTLTADPPGGITHNGLPASIAAGITSVQLFACDTATPGIKTGKLTFSTNESGAPTYSYDIVCTVDKAPDPFIASTSALTTGLGAGTNPYGLAVSPDGAHVYVAAGGASAIAAYAINPDTQLPSHIQTFESASLSVSNRFTTPYQVAVSMDGRNVYATGLGGDSLVTFARDADTGELSHVDTVRDGAGYGCTLNQGCAGNVSGMDGAYGIALSPDGAFIYVSSTVDDSVVVFRRDQTTGAASSTSLLGSGAYFVQRFTHPTLNSVYGIALSPDGASLYVTGYLSDALLTLKRDPQSGQLSYVGTTDTTTVAGLNGVFRVTVNAAGDALYTASYDSNSVCHFRRNITNGQLTPAACSQPPGAPVQATDVALMPDGKRLLSGYFGGDAVAVYAVRDNNTLAFQALITPTTFNGSAQIDAIRGLAPHPGGEAVYATAINSDVLLTLRVARPVALLSALSPASAAPGSGAIQVTLIGKDFHPSSRARIGNTALTTQYVSPSKLIVTLPANFLAAPVELTLFVFTDSPGGGPSNGIKFYVQSQAVPVISAINLPGALAGAESATLEVNGSGFGANAVVLVNGAARPTERVSEQLLRATLSAADLANIGTLAVSVDNGPVLLQAASADAGPADSNAVTFEVVRPNANPPAGISALSPVTAAAQGKQAQLVITITGANFVSGAQARWNGEDRLTEFVNASTLRMTISAADLIVPGLASVTVENPAPEGGGSGTLTFTVTEPEPEPPPVLYTHLPVVMRR